MWPNKGAAPNAAFVSLSDGLGGWAVLELFTGAVGGVGELVSLDHISIVVGIGCVTLDGRAFPSSGRGLCHRLIALVARH